MTEVISGQASLAPTPYGPGYSQIVNNLYKHHTELGFGELMGTDVFSFISGHRAQLGQKSAFDNYVVLEKKTEALQGN